MNRLSQSPCGDMCTGNNDFLDDDGVMNTTSQPEPVHCKQAKILTEEAMKYYFYRSGTFVEIEPCDLSCHQ